MGHLYKQHTLHYFQNSVTWPHPIAKYASKCILALRNGVRKNRIGKSQPVLQQRSINIFSNKPKLILIQLYLSKFIFIFLGKTLINSSISWNLMSVFFSYFFCSVSTSQKSYWLLIGCLRCHLLSEIVLSSYWNVWSLSLDFHNTLY